LVVVSVQQQVAKSSHVCWYH